VKKADRIAAEQALYRQRMAELAAWRLTQACKDSGNVEVRGDGGCLRCEADAGEACRGPEAA
jgi:hypothetical protein